MGATRLSTIIIGFLILGIDLRRVNGAEPIPPEKFNSIRAAIKPYPGEEKWMQIPWLSSLWEARKQAAAEGKPIFLWEMDGHPLGCT